MAEQSIDMGMVSDTSPPSPPAPTAPPLPASPAPAPARVTPGSKAWAEMTPEQRHEQLRGPPNPRSVGHSPARDQREAAAARAAGEPPPLTPSADAPVLNAEKVKIGKYEVSEADVGAMMQRQAQDDLRKATVPPTPDKYEAKLPADFKPPAGIDYKFDANDPSLVAARNWAHARGLSQDDFSQLLSLHAAHVTGQEAALAESARAEIAKAGVNAPQRVDAVGRWITSEVGEADAKPIRATIVTDAHLRFYERMMTKLTSQGAASFSQSHRATPEANKIPGYENMSFEQRRHAQEQISGRTR